ncbi:MAG: hypothetical protein ABF676_08010 [Schleiferilactobacillus harbinensis]|uniref:hypothetical protein n=1 Tax=Schleiferilactobacillus harbinensis TaxID=304207 RepID=UPI0039E8DFE9
MTKLKGLAKTLAQIQSGHGQPIEDLAAWSARMREEAAKMPPIPDPLPAHGFRLLPKKEADRPIFGGYGVKHGLLKPYASDLETDEYGFRRRIFRSLQYRPVFETQVIRVFQETFPVTTPDDTKAFRNYVRAYIAGWDYMYLFRLNQAFIELKQTFSLPLASTEERYLAAVTADDSEGEETAQERMAADAQQLDQQSEALFALLQEGQTAVLATKVMIDEMIRQQHSTLDAELKRKMKRFREGYLIPRMFDGPVSEDDAGRWSKYLRDHVPGWWD